MGQRRACQELGQGEAANANGCGLSFWADRRSGTGRRWQGLTLYWTECHSTFHALRIQPQSKTPNHRAQDPVEILGQLPCLAEWGGSLRADTCHPVADGKDLCRPLLKTEDRVTPVTSSAVAGIQQGTRGPRAHVKRRPPFPAGHAVVQSQLRPSGAGTEGLVPTQEDAEHGVRLGGAPSPGCAPRGWGQQSPRPRAPSAHVGVPWGVYSQGELSVTPAICPRQHDTVTVKKPLPCWTRVL